MYRLAKLLSTDNYLGNMKIPAELIAMKKVMEIAEQKEDEKQIDSIGFDSSYMGLVSSLTDEWDENTVSFYNYENIPLEDDKLNLSNLFLKDYIIERLKENGYTNILQLNNMKLSRARKRPKLGKASVLKIQRALRDYYQQFSWEDCNVVDEHT